LLHRFYADCDVPEATTDVQLYERADGDMPPPQYSFTETATDRKCTTNVASKAGHWGAGHSLATCQEECEGVADCYYVTHDTKGYCR
jgi:hypothetical protein